MTILLLAIWLHAARHDPMRSALQTISYPEWVFRPYLERPRFDRRLEAHRVYRQRWEEERRSRRNQRRRQRSHLARGRRSR